MAMTTRLKSLALIGLCLSVTLAGCGRKGGLDDPSAPPAQEGTAVDPAVAAQVEPAPPQNNKSFPLDFLIQ
ncbi:lipoprotein [Roseibium sp.]|uniref:lipoprotein n=1 Tax=Roseibium sp. TaxID=1936156 RepID=UPI003BAE7EE5